MHFDDRLATVLRMRAEGDGLRRIQFRQLLDLLGTLPAEAHGNQVDAAYDRLAQVGGGIAPAERVAMLRDPALRLRSPRLVALLSASDPAVAEVTLARAQLSSEQWLDLVPALAPTSRSALRQRGDMPAEVTTLLSRLGVMDRGLPPAVNAVQVESKPVLANDDDVAVDAADAPNRDEGIGAIVRRIEAYRRAKTVVEHTVPGDSPRLPLGEDHVLSVPAEVRAADFASDAQLRIVWCDAGVAPMLVGMQLKRGETIERLLRQRQPITGQRLSLTGAPAIAGEWQIDAAPWFEPLTGRFIGYRGRLRRPAPATSSIPNPPITDSAPDRIRQMLHELRTPVNAIQGFAEVIQQQLFGPTPHEYRALAASIAGDAARMLSAFEELERLARLESGAMQIESGQTDLTELVSATVAQLGAHTSSRGSGFDLKIDDQPLPVGLDRLELERIVWRLLATVAGTSAPLETLKLRLRSKGGMARLDLALPVSINAMPGNTLFEAGVGAVPQIISAGVFGVGFALRLARAEARAAGGDLVRKADRLRLTLPGLTGSSDGHSHGSEVASRSA